ncbi:MAG: hypothetical protein D6732_15945 [Methanobacteriota archaeon]|nr:MAG: hypothetical protein D6732_15945 [Euryarchaeota archaeon]
MDWKPEEIRIRLSRLLDTLVSLAMEDNLVTDDEEAIIERIRFTLWSLENELMGAQNIDEYRFKEKIQTLFDNALQQVIMTARADGLITSDENRLITKIKEFLQNNGLSRLL